MLSGSNALWSSQLVTYYATVGSNVDLVADAAAALAGTSGNQYASRPGSCRQLIASVGGNVNMTLASGQNITIPLASNVAYPIQATKLLASGTTATGILVLY